MTFFDVPGAHWACTQIRQLAGLGLLPFGEGGWFLPSATVSWRELCSVLDTLAGSETGCEAFPALTAAWEEKTVLEAGARECRRQRVGQPCRVCACMQQPAWPQSGWERCAAARRGVVLGQSG